MKLVILSIQSSKEPWLDEAVKLFSNKISHFTKIEILHLKSKDLGRDAKDKKLHAETALLLSKINYDDYVILCDERGEMLDSLKFAKKMEQWLSSSKKRLVFVIGGAFGVSEELQSRANYKWSFSSMVMNHHLAQVVALEQIYRASTILKGLPYHNA